MYDLIIIGAGPAGLTAALYAGRFRLNTLIIEKMAAGGQIILSYTIENFPGFPGGIETAELMNRFQKQIEDLGIRTENKEITGISRSAQGGKAFYSLFTQEGDNYQARALVLATGALPKRLGVLGEERFIGRGISYCGTCDGPLFRNKEIAVVGGGDRAVEEAIFLTRYASKVNIIHRRASLRASRILEESARNNPKINFILDSVIEEILGKDRVSAVKIKNIKTDKAQEVSVEGLFIFIGIIPNTGFLKKIVDISEEGFIITDQEMRTSQDGIFACGDCRKKSLYQVITACGEGATAADSAYKYLTNI